MDAGVPLRSHVAGVSIGLITIVDESTGKITDYRLLTDILGLEDHVGDMDFKIAGTRSGITAIQLDIKPCGIPLEVLCEALEPARVAREHILERMEQEIREPSTEQKENAPRKGYFSIQRECVSRLIGPQGSTVKHIERTTGVRITISDAGRVCVIAKDQASYDQAKEMVDATLGTDIEVGNIYDVCVTSIKDFGAFVEVDGGYQGLLHISELSQQKVFNVMDVLTLGQKLKVMCIGRDSRGHIKFSLKAMLLSSKPSAAMEKVEPTTTVVTEGATAMAKTEREVLVYEFPSARPKSIWGAVKTPKEMVVQDQGQVEHSKKKGLDLHKEATEMPLSSAESEGVKRTDLLKEAIKMPLSSAESKGVTRLDRDKVTTKVPLSSAENKGVTRLDLHKEATKVPLSSEESKGGTRKSVETNQKFPVEVDEEYLAVVHQVKALGAVLKMMDGGLGKLFFDKETTSSSIQSGEILLVKCSRIDSTGRPVFTLARSSQDSK